MKSMLRTLAGTVLVHRSFNRGAGRRVSSEARLLLRSYGEQGRFFDADAEQVDW
jgi:hypothetical protein